MNKYTLYYSRYKNKNQQKLATLYRYVSKKIKITGGKDFKKFIS